MLLDEYLADRGKCVSLQTHDHLFRQGDHCDSCYLLKKGILKACYLTTDGKEFIKSFFIPGSTVGSLRSLMRDEPSPFGVVALQTSSLLQFSLKDLRATAAKDLQLATQLIDFLTNLAIRKEQREEEFLTLSPEERYKKLRSENPNLLESVTQNDIARYLGITPVALSRIRNRIKKSP